MNWWGILKQTYNPQDPFGLQGQTPQTQQSTGIQNLTGRTEQVTQEAMSGTKNVQDTLYEGNPINPTQAGGSARYTPTPENTSNVQGTEASQQQTGLQPSQFKNLYGTQPIYQPQNQTTQIEQNTTSAAAGGEDDSDVGDIRENVSRAKENLSQLPRGPKASELTQVLTDLSAAAIDPVNQKQIAIQAKKKLQEAFPAMA